jgi:hypothetical protein
LPGTCGHVTKLRAGFHGPCAIHIRHARHGSKRLEEGVSQRRLAIEHLGDLDGVIDVRNDDDSGIIKKAQIALEYALVLNREHGLQSGAEITQFFHLRIRQLNDGAKITIGTGFRQRKFCFANPHNHFPSAFVIHHKQPCPFGKDFVLFAR